MKSTREHCLHRQTHRFHAALDKHGVTTRVVRLFRGIIYEYYRNSPRHLPWRRTRDPYRILVSEIMLQQTQVGRVKEKYELFLREFPDFPALARASLSEVLAVWQGLGYNRRAAALKNLAVTVMNEYGGCLPLDKETLIKLPGIGKYTAPAISTFALNTPDVFIETNIRRVFIHFFFGEKESISDKEIIPLVTRTLDASHPREWYYALMDYGAMLKKCVVNPNRKSIHYRTQSPFHGSDRQVRGSILKTLLRKPGISKSALAEEANMDPVRVEKNLDQLVKEGFVKKEREKFLIA